MSGPARDGGVIQRDLYCLTCGYNLRGLSGDPVRCPECGQSHERAALEIPATAIRAALRRLETAPAYNFLGLVGAPLLAWAIYPAARQNAAAPTLPCLTLLVVALVCSVPFTLLHYRRTCRGRPGWLAALLRFHVGTLVMLAMILVAPFSLAWLAPFGRRSGTSLANWTPWLGLAALPLAVLWFCVMWRLLRWTKAPMEALQRDVAVEVAREELRRRGARRPLPADHG